MAIRLITKKTGRVFARVHCIMFYMGKGDNISGKPYGIIPTTDDDPLGLTFDNTNRTISIKPGQLYCYGRQCIVTETTQVLDMTDWALSAKCLGTIYLRIDLVDTVDQDCRVGMVSGTVAYVDFDENMNHSNLYKRSNGTYDVPIARFVYDPDGPDDIYFSKYEKVIPELDEQARAYAKKVNNIGVTGANALLDGAEVIKKAEHADQATEVTYFNDTQIRSDLSGLWTARRTKILDHSNFNFNASTSMNVAEKVDTAHLQYAHIFSESRYTRNSIDYDFYMKFTSTETDDNTTYAKLSFSSVVELGKKYYLILDYKKDRRLNGYRIWDYVVSESEGNRYQITLAWFRISATKIEWQGLYDTSKTYVNNIKGQPLLMTGFDTSNKFFYDITRGLSIYVDFLYKGDVNVS